MSRGIERLVAGLCVLVSVGCGDHGGGLELGEAEQPLFLTWYGSDAMRRAIRTEEWRIGMGLDFLGQGSLVGQAALASASQCLAPMSSDFTTCHSGAKTFPVALDGITLYTANGTMAPVANPATQVTFNVLKRLFSGNGSGGSCAQYRWSDAAASIGDLRTTAAAFNAKPIKLYRLDDDSGTTRVFKSKLGITAFCTSPTVNITIVRDDNVGCAGVTGPCVTCSGRSATDCIPEVVGTNELALGFASIGAATDVSYGASVKKLSVSAEQTNPTGGTYRAPTVANIQKLLPQPSQAYPLSRPLFVNRDINNACTAAEVNFKNRSLGAETCAFENTMAAQGLVPCIGGGPRTDPHGDCLQCPAVPYACP